MKDIEFIELWNKKNVNKHRLYNEPENIFFVSQIRNLPLKNSYIFYYFRYSESRKWIIYNFYIYNV